jgi:EmrB/QacA subfamily drug resistance transporter
MQRTPTTTTTTTSSRHNLTMVVVLLALAAVVAAMASLNVALPSIARDTHASQTQLVWVIDAYSLAFAALLLPAGGIGDRFGRRVALVIGLAIFGGGSAVATRATSADELIALRALIGVGAALVMPATLSTITSTFPESKRPRAISAWAAVAACAAVVGLFASGTLLAWFSWRSIFVLNVVLSVVALVGTLRFVPESADPDAPRLDFAGAAIAVAALAALVFSVIEAPTAGWLATRTVVGLALGAALVAVFVVWELRQDAPLLNPRVFRRRPLSAASMSIFVGFFAFYGYSFIVLQYLQLVRGDTALLAAVHILPTAAAAMPATRLSPRLTRRYGTRAVCVAGLLLTSAGLAIVAMLGTHTPYWHLTIGLVILGVGMGVSMTPATTAITEALPRSQQGVGSALNDLSREVGGAIGIAVIGSVLTAVYSSVVNLGGLSSQVAGQVKSSYAIATQLPPPAPDRAHTAFVSAMHIALLTAAGAVLLAAVGVAILLARRSRTVPADELVHGRDVTGAKTAVPPSVPVGSRKEVPRASAEVTSQLATSGTGGTRGPA